MTPKKIIPVEVKGISYMLDNSICIDLIGGDEILKFNPSDVLDMFHGLLQAIGAKKYDELFCAIDDILTALPYEDEGKTDERRDAVDEAAVEMIVELAG